MNPTTITTETIATPTTFTFDDVEVRTDTDERGTRVVSTPGGPQDLIDAPGADDPGVLCFQSARFGQVRTTERDGKVLFCGRDVAAALGYKDPTNALKTHCRGVAVHHPISDRLGRPQTARFIGEGDVYRLITHSRLPAAEQFEQWVFDEVLPAIRRHGGYLTPQAAEAALTDPDFIIRLATSLKEERAARTAAEQQATALAARVEADAPHTRLGRAVSESEGDVLVKAVADVLTQEGVPCNQVKLFRWLRAHGWLCRSQGDMWNRPTKWALEKGYVRAVEHVVSTRSGSRLRWVPRVTGLGQQVLVDGFTTGRFDLNEEK